MIRLPAAKDPEVSVIVLLDGAVELAERCLAALAGDPGVPAEVVILLNDPDEELERFVRGSTTGGKVVLSRANAGPGVGWNLGGAVAEAPRLATMHEDSEPEPGWLRPLCETMSETGAGAVGSRLFNADGSVQNCGWVLFSDAAHQPLNAATAPEVAAASEPTPADMLSGAAMLVDREAAAAVGGWDERFFPAVFMDIDISTAMWGLGRPVLSVPDSRVVHASGTFDRRPNSLLTGPRLRLFLFERNRHRFTDKWGPAVTDLAPAPTDAEPETIRAAVEAALPHTRARLERVLGGAAAPSPPAQAEARFTGVAEPVVADGEGGYRVAPEVESALRATEGELIDDYLRWLIGREDEVSGHLATAHDALAHQRRDIDRLNGAIEDLRRHNRELSAALDGLLNSRTWRLRTRAARLLGREPASR
ncbi:MAG TPA: glycosyltransferase [Solirubrobacterales bacterium]|nr:glycosyltransferase [Solirubrobacterales bacterium]